MSDGGLLLTILAQSAFRSLVVGLCVLVPVRLARLRDPRTETAIWGVVLLAALAMPWLSRWLPVGLDLLPAPVSPLLWIAYCLVAAVGLARLAIGLILTARLYLRAEPVREPWAEGRRVRAGADVDSPLAFGTCILLPADYGAWSPACLAAVLAHEECHVRRGDFFIQLLAGCHRAIFWFSPFAWWLQRRLTELAETASDTAAIRRIADPQGYAEILLDVARRARRLPSAQAVAMARGPGLAQRVNDILSGAPERSLSAPVRLMAVTLTLGLAVGVAAVRAAAPETNIQPAASPLARTAALPPAAVRVVLSRATLRKARTRARTIAAAAQEPSKPAESDDDVSYDPLALLDGPSVMAAQGFILAGPVGRPAPQAGQASGD